MFQDQKLCCKIFQIVRQNNALFCMILEKKHATSCRKSVKVKLGLYKNDACKIEYITLST